MKPTEILRDVRPVILPSMLQNDFTNLAALCTELEQAGARGLHLDVMDGTFVPNLSYGIPIVSAFRQSTDLVLDCHLMIAEPEKYVEQFAKAGADIITIHLEATENVEKCIETIRSVNADVGLAVNPDTPIEKLRPFSDQCDLILIMSVHAGFGGQSFIENSISRIKEARNLPGNFLLEVDGGINTSTITKCASAGSDLFVVGSALFGKDDYSAAIAELEELAGATRENA